MGSLECVARFRRAAIVRPMNALDLGTLRAGARVVVAMSGGVDSSVAAALLRDRGLDVIGITLQLYDQGAAVGRKGACCAGQDIHDARRVADRLGIPHYVLDYETRFHAAVIDDFVDSYAAGETPIPCVRCNQRVKFHDLLGTARDLGAEALVTGHYARRVEGAEGPELHRAADPARDQSYFLFATTPEQLAFLRFPLGGLQKEEVRQLAERLGLPVAAKPDSQDICFVPDGRYTRIVERLRPEAMRPGEIVHVDGRILGRHAGVAYYTVGQRRGLNLGGGEPLYVVRLEPEAARVLVGPRRALEERRVWLREVNWLLPEPRRAGGLIATIKLRSMSEPARARLWPDASGRTVEVALEEPQLGVAPGQAGVFYDGDRLLGGGWIASRTAQLAA